MTLNPLIEATLAIQIHVLSVVPATLLGAWMLIARKGTPTHKLLGKVWLVLMAVAAISSFFIHTIRIVGPFSPIHLLSVVTLISCIRIIVTARKGQIKAHRKTVKALYWGGIGVAGFFAFMPGRIMNKVIFGDAGFPMTLVAVMVAIVSLAYAAFRFGQLKRRFAKSN